MLSACLASSWRRSCARGLFAQPVDDAALKLAEPDFTLTAFPTALRLPKFGSAFRVTHRFTRPLGSGDFGDLAADFFGMDTGAQIGLEYRFGIIPSGQIGVLRTSDREIEFFAGYGISGKDQAAGSKSSPSRRSRVATISRTPSLRRSARSCREARATPWPFTSSQSG